CATAPNTTANLLVDMAARSPNLPLQVLPTAYPDRQTALGAGFEASSYDLLLVTTADGQFDVLELNHLLEAIEHGADLAIGYRPARADGVLRRLSGWLHTAALNLLYCQTVRDVDCEFRLFRRVVWERVQPRPRGTSFNAEMLARARRLGFVINEVPVTHRRPRQPDVATSRPISMGRRAA
ncbi:MAG TPA: glycosyltransferase, partial [Chloroflexota bacterium]|nr:glycosyltransferase [Chloroflexota bacterium]